MSGLIVKWFGERLIRRVTRRPPDFVIGGEERPYLLRWWLIPRNPVLNVYLHQFRRSDDDRALHDHPWANLSVLLRGQYIEHTIAAGGVEHRAVLMAGDWRFRWTGRIAHRVELFNRPINWRAVELPDGRMTSECDWGPTPCWSLFITGPKYRSWGFHCPKEGWIHWKRFTADSDSGSIGKGCDA